MSDSRLTELALRWEEFRDQGQIVSAEALCQECPELLEPLRQRIQALQDMDQMLVVPPSQPVAGCTTIAVPGQPTARQPVQDLEAPAISGYEILEMLGQGGMGVVFRARQLRLGRIVALKMILPGRKPSETEAARFRREIETVAELQHPNIVQIYEVGDYDGKPFFSLEFCAGGSLADRLMNGPLPPREAAELVRTLAGAMAAAHCQGIIHRDLKPGNILLHKDGSPRITDFGLARRLDSEDGLTVTGAILGTPSYMAPEQAAGHSREVGTPADIYALGAILYELLTGRPPFRADTPWNTVRLVISGEPVPPRRLQARVPADLETICLKCLEKEPNRRYHSALDLAEDLRRYLAHEPILARPVSLTGRLLRWCRRHPAMAGLAGTLLLALVIIAVGGVAYNFRLSQALLEAGQQAEITRQSLIRLHVLQGTRLVDEGDPLRALVWYAEALRLEEGKPGRELAHRVRLATTLRECPRLIQLWFHEGPVQVAVFSPGGGVILTASDDKTARLWDPASGEPIGSPLDHGAAVASAVFRPDGKVVATVGADGAACLWDVPSGQLLLTLKPNSRPLTCVAFDHTGQHLLTAGEDGTARIWDTKTGQPLLPPLEHGGTVRWASFSPDGSRVVTAGQKSARLWLAANGEPAAPEMRHDGPVTDALFSPDGRYVLTASMDGTARLWDSATGKRLRIFRHRRTVVQALFSPDGELILTASDDHTACLWDTATGERRGEPLRHPSGLNAATFSADGRLIATAGDDNSARVWSALTGEALTPMLQHNGSVNAVAFSPDGRRLVSAASDHQVRLWDLTALPPAGPRPWANADESRPPSRFLSSDGQFEAVVEKDQTVRVQDALSRKVLSPPLSHGSTVTHAVFSPDNRLLLTSSDDNCTRIWSWAAGELVTAPLTHKGGVLQAVFSPDARRVATVCADGTARAWDAETGHPLTPPLPHAGAVQHMAFSTDDNQLTISGKEMAAVTWDLHPDERPATDLMALAKLLAGSRIDPTRGLFPLRPAELQPVWRDLRARYPADLAPAP